jgi:SAM-dependent methyltransferase
MIPDMAADISGTPSRWVRRFAPLIVPGGRVLDLACGSGRHSLILAQQGFQVEAVDRDAAAIAAHGRLAIPGIATRGGYRGRPVALLRLSSTPLSSPTTCSGRCCRNS